MVPTYRVGVTPNVKRLPVGNASDNPSGSLVRAIVTSISLEHPNL